MLYLGQRDGKMCGIETKNISNYDKDHLLKQKEKFKTLDLEHITSWIKTHTPEAYKKGYREIYLTNLKVINTYNLS